MVTVKVKYKHRKLHVCVMLHAAFSGYVYRHYTDIVKGKLLLQNVATLRTIVHWYEHGGVFRDIRKEQRHILERHPQDGAAVVNTTQFARKQLNVVIAYPSIFIGQN